jgi:hypothetical protein
VQWLTSIIQVTWEVEFGRIVVREQPELRVSEAPISTTKLDVVLTTCNPS